MRYIRSVSWLIVIVFASTSLVACFATTNQTSPQNHLTSMDFVGEKSVKYLIRPRLRETYPEKIKNKNITLYNLNVQICDVTEQDEQTNCKTSPVLKAVRKYGGSVTDESGSDTDTAAEDMMAILEGGSDMSTRAIDNLFWYDADTLYVSYRVYGGAAGGASGMLESVPKVKRCSIASDNSLKCQPDTTVSNSLFQQEVKESG